MKKVTRRELYQLALEAWGADAQIGMFIEEIGEVLTALNKMNRKSNGCSTEDFIEELVDLEIMLEQMKNLFPCTDWNQIKYRKLSRLEEKLGVILEKD